MANSATPDEISLARYREYLRSLVNAQVGLQPQLDASDIVQDTMLKAHRAIGKFRGRTEPQLVAWLRAILANTVRNARRTFSRRNRHTDYSLNAANERSSAQPGADLVDSSPSAGQIAARNEQHLRLVEALVRLPDEQRTIVDMKYVQGCSLGEICERTGRSKPSVVGLLYRGMKALRVLLDQ